MPIISTFTGGARHGWEKMTPSMGFGMSRPQNQQEFQTVPPNAKRAVNGSAMSPNPAVAGHIVNLSFNVPFNSNLAGPEAEDVLVSSKGAWDRWIHPPGTAKDTPNYVLPVHTRNVEVLRHMCKQMSESSDGAVHAAVTSSKPKPVPGMQRGPLSALVTNVCISGDAEVVHRMRAKILNESSITLRCETIDIDRETVFPKGQNVARKDVIDHITAVAEATKADIFLLESKTKKKDSDAASFNSAMDKSMDNRLRLLVYGDMDNSENAKTRLLIMIDKLPPLQRQVDAIQLDHSMHGLISGRHRRNIKLIESATGTAIYFPPLFPGVFGNAPVGAIPYRAKDEILITGENMDSILQAKKKLQDLIQNSKNFVKDVHVTVSKVDCILLERLDKIRKIVEANGSHVLLPPLGANIGLLRVAATDILNIERTTREIMSLAGQFYSASWWLTEGDSTQRQPTASEIRAMLSDICINSGSEVTFEKMNFHINGSDDSVKAAMSIINTLPFVKKARSTLRVKIELANEHKEFVSGKKNGKINKIMSQANVQIVFDGWNEYNFYIDVRGAQYDATKNGLDLVEMEMPASVSFHVPDQYHKRIIGIGGQHIQRIMKKYSVFVKFSNAMDRGGIGKDDDDVKVDNVICRTPARNVDNLELVKQEIMDLVEKCDKDFGSEQIHVDRLYHRELLTRMPEIEELEKKHNCKIIFPSTEQASNMVTISGPEYQVPFAVDEFLGMVPDSHLIEFPTSTVLRNFLTSPEFQTEVVQKLKDQYVVDVVVNEPKVEKEGEEEVTLERLVLNYTRNNEPGLKDAIDFLLLPLMNQGLDQMSVRGAIPRPKSDSFEDSMPYFESKLLHRAEPPMSTESPTRSNFTDDSSSRSIFDKLRRPGGMSSFANFMERRRKTGSNSPGSFVMLSSNNASKASLVSMESRDSGYRNPWNDSGIDLDHDPTTTGNGWGSFASASRPNTSSHSLTGTFETKFPFGSNGNASTTSLNTPMIPGLGMVNGTHSVAEGATTPRTRSATEKEETNHPLPPTTSKPETAPSTTESATATATAATATTSTTTATATATATDTDTDTPNATAAT